MIWGKEFSKVFIHKKLSLLIFFLCLDLVLLMVVKSNFNLVSLQTEFEEVTIAISKLYYQSSARIHHLGFADESKHSGISLANDWTWSKLRNRESVYNYAQEMSGGVVAADFYGDGLPDLYFVSGNYGHLYRNLGDFKFEDITEASGLKPFERGTGAVAADYDNDGKIDLLLYGVGSTPRLYRNLGQGKFRDVSEEAGLNKLPNSAYFGAAFNDYDHDGWLDLYLVNFSDLNQDPKYGPRGERLGQPNILLKNSHGVFSDVTSIAGVGDSQQALAVSFLDFDNDGWDDIFVINDNGYNTLYKNNHNGTFSDVSLSALDGKIHNGMGIAVADFNNDGWLDAYVTNINYQGSLIPPQSSHLKKIDQMGNLLLLNAAGQTYKNLGHSSPASIGGWGWGTTTLDYNNDGWSDLVSVSGFSAILAPDNPEMQRLSKSHGYFFENQGDGKFKDKSNELAFFADHDPRGLVSVDLNNDGYPDIVVNQISGDPKIYRNLGNSNHYLKIKLVGSASNRSGIGAKVWVTAGSQTYLKELETAGSYLSSSEPVLIFGLGKEPRSVDIKVQWPSGLISIRKGLMVNEFISISE